MEIIKELKDRKVRKYLGIYISGCVTVIGLTHLFSLRYSLPAYIFDTLLILVMFGILSVLIIAWNHGKAGKQKTRWWEYILHLLIFLFAFIFIYIQYSKATLNILPLNSNTIAVIPFINMSDSKEDEYFSDGIMEDILTQLSKISDFKVISRTTMMKYKKTDLSIKEIGRRLGAGSILEGSVRRYEDKVRITAQLINSSRDEHLWAETFDRKISDIFEVQSEIAKHIVNQLEAKLAPKEELRINSKPTQNINAYAYYLKGRESASKYTDIDNQTAISLYKKALTIDSNYALAYAGLASSYDQKVRRYFYGEEWQDSAIEMSKTALALDPNLAEGHSSLAKSYEAKGQYSLAKYHYERAIRSIPNYYAAIYNLGVVYFNEEKLDKAYQLIKHSIQLEPDNVFGYIVLGSIYRKFGCYQLALEQFEKSVELEPENLLSHLYLADYYLLMKDFANSEKALNNLQKLSPEWPFGLMQTGKLLLLTKDYKNALIKLEEFRKKIHDQEEFDYAYVLLKNNFEKRSKGILEQEIERYSANLINIPDQAFLSQYNLSVSYSLLGRKDEAIDHLEKSIQKGFIDHQKIQVYPYMDSISTNPKFQNSLIKMKHKADSMKALAESYDDQWLNCR